MHMNQYVRVGVCADVHKCRHAHLYISRHTHINPQSHNDMFIYMEPSPPPTHTPVNSTGNSPSPGRPTPGIVKQDKSSGGSVDTTKIRLGPQSVGMCSGERPIGTAKGKQSDTEVLCHPPPPPHTHYLWFAFVCFLIGSHPPGVFSSRQAAGCSFRPCR